MLPGDSDLIKKAYTLKPSSLDESDLRAITRRFCERLFLSISTMSGVFISSRTAMFLRAKLLSTLPIPLLQHYKALAPL
jgi:hypothetical protein